MENDEYTLQHKKNLVQHSSSTTEQTFGEQVSARENMLLTCGERQVAQQASSAPMHKKNKHKKCCMKLFLNFQSITASNESISINTEHIGDENSTRRTS